jgi:hypothetical protein
MAAACSADDPSPLHRRHHLHATATRPPAAMSPPTAARRWSASHRSWRGGAHTGSRTGRGCRPATCTRSASGPAGASAQRRRVGRGEGHRGHPWYRHPRGDRVPAGPDPRPGGARGDHGRNAYFQRRRVGRPRIWWTRPPWPPRPRARAGVRWSSFTAGLRGRHRSQDAYDRPRCVLRPARQADWSAGGGTGPLRSTGNSGVEPDAVRAHRQGGVGADGGR